MRILRLQLKNFRGVVESEVRFARDGVTVVEGPNEVGKSSFVESIDMLLDFFDDARNQKVKAIQPVGRDVATEIEMDAEIGPYAFTYRKRFHREKLTELSISRPSPEQWKGREAHERVQQILGDHMDYALWKAIRVSQGDGEAQPVLDKQTSLSEALDRVAGGARASEREESLFERVENEYQLYFTAKQGQPTGKYRDAIVQMNEAQLAVDSLQSAMKGLEDDVRRAAHLAGESARVVRSLSEARLVLMKREEQAAALHDKREAVESLGQKLVPVAHDAAATSKAVRERERMAAELAKAEEVWQAASAERASADPLATEVSASMKTVESAYLAAKDAVELAISLERIRRNDDTFRRNEIELARNRERHARVVSATEKGVRAKAELDGNLVTDDALERIRSSEQALLRAQDVLRAASPKLHVLALQPAALTLSGRALSLGTGQEVEESVVSELALDVDGKVRVTFSPGQSADELKGRLAQAQNAFSAALSETRVSSLEDAVEKNARRHEAERALTDLKRVINDDLRDWTRDQLARSIANLERSTAAHAAERPAQPPMASELREARRLHEAAEAELAVARETLEHADRERDLVRVRASEVGKRLAEADSLLRVAAERKAFARSALSEAEKGASLDSLREAYQNLSTQEMSLREQLGKAEDELRKAEPALVDARLSEAKDVVVRLVDEHGNVNLQLAKTHAVLETKNEQGYGEALALAESKLHHTATEHAALQRHASAARLLYETMSRARDNARRRYVAPLQERINALGRMVFDSSFHVDVGDDLCVLSRTLGAQTVPFESLSQGAREQLALLVRLACGLLVAKNGGVPLIFDDVLGATDSTRLAEMATALRHAGKECQIIVLTCMPERFTHVSGARVSLTHRRALTPSVASE